MAEDIGVSTDDQDLVFAELARDLFDHFKAKEFGGLREDSPSGENSDSEKPRIVVVVGAGASAEAGLPLGQELKEALYQELIHPDRGLLKKEGVLKECDLYRARVDSGANPGEGSRSHDLVKDPSFNLLEFCQALKPAVGVRTFIRETIIERLEKPASWPLLSYELIAHMLNHGFIDHVISLNFDTLLDQSLQDELGYDGVDIIVSDRDIAKSSRFERIPGIDDPPRYVKPHGSVTSPDSLRFTLADTGGVFRAMHGEILRTLFGEGVDGPEPPDEKLTLILAGWACHEPSFRRILMEHSARIGKIYWLYPSEHGESMRDGSITPLGQNLANKVRSLRFGLSRVADGGLGGALVNVFNWLFMLAGAKQVSLPPIARHLLYCYCFSPDMGNRTPPASQEQDLLLADDRLRFEIFYFSLKCKGFFCSYNMAQVRRVQDALRRFLRLSEANSLRAKQLQMHRSRDQDLVMSCFGRDNLTYSNLEEYEYLPPTSGAVGKSMERLLDYFWSKRDRYRGRNQQLEIPHYLTFSEGAGSPPSERFDDLMKDHLRQTDFQQGEEDLANHLVRHLETVRCMCETEVSKSSGRRTLWLFRKSHQIRSVGELKQQTLVFLREDGWNRLRVIAETGEWLLEARVRQELTIRSDKGGPLKIELIAREEAVPLALHANHANEITNRFAEEFGDRVQLTLKTLAWRRHNTHLTLFLKDDRALRGLYFRRRLYAPVIYPVRIDLPDDAALLNRFFDEHLERVKVWNKTKPFQQGRLSTGAAG